MTMKEQYREIYDGITPDETLKKAVKERAFHKNRKVPAAWAAALILVVALGSATSVVAAVSYLPFFQAYSGHNESGYTVQLKVERVDHEAFDGEIAEVRGIVLRQIQNAKPWDNQMPNVVRKQFDSVADGMDYIGVIDSYHAIDRTLPARMEIMCNESGEIEHILVETNTKIWGNNVQIWYHIFSDLSADTDSRILRMETSGKEDFQPDAKTLKDGTQVRIVTQQNAEQIVCASGYFSEGPIVYFINAAAADGSGHSARETVEKALELLTEP